MQLGLRTTAASHNSHQWSRRHTQEPETCLIIWRKGVKRKENVSWVWANRQLLEIIMIYSSYSMAGMWHIGKIDHLQAPVTWPTQQHLDVLQPRWALGSIFAMCLHRSRGWVEVSLHPVAWSLLDLRKQGGIEELGQNPLPLQICRVCLVLGPENGLWRPRSEGQRLRGSGTTPHSHPSSWPQLLSFSSAGSIALLLCK